MILFMFNGGRLSRRRSITAGRYLAVEVHAPTSTGPLLGYRDGVADRLRAWFEDNVELRKELERREARAWEMSFIAPLWQAAGLSGESGAGDGAPGQTDEARVEE